MAHADVSNAVGLIGLGLLGTALAERLLLGGFRVTGFDLEANCRRGLTDRGGQAALSAPDAAAAGERLVLCLPNSDVVEGVLADVQANLRPGTIVIDATTGDPDRTAATGARLAALGIHYLDATVVGSSEQVRNRDAVAVVGGDLDVANRCADLFACYAREWFHVGPCGCGARMKLAVNLVLGLNRAVLAEGLAFARAAGLDPAEALRVLRASAAYSRVMDVKGDKMVGHDFRPQARLAQHLKDVNLILASAERCGAVVPLSEQHRELLDRAVAMGLGDADNSAIIRAFEHRATDQRG